MLTTLNNVRIARVSTIPFFVVTQLQSQLETLASVGAEVYIVTSNDKLVDRVQSIKGCNFKPIEIAREISPWADLKALVKLWWFFRKGNFQIVHSTTPKAGLLCAIAGKLAGIPICIHTFTGQTWVTMHGFKKWLVQWSDKLIAKLNVLCYTDSFSQRDFLIKNKIVSADKIKVLGNGSLAGVDVTRFSQERFTEETKKQLRASLNIKDSTKVLLFIGRITQDKGVFDLFEAINQIKQQEQDIVLIVVGPFEQNNEHEVRSMAEKLCGDRIHFAGFQAEPERYMAISDLLCLPSYREGFGTVVIEAAAMSVPTVGTNIYGLTDAVVNGETGILVEPKNSAQLASAIKELLSNDALRSKLGEQAKERALNEFETVKFNGLLVQKYIKMLKKVGYKSNEAQ